MKNILLVIQLSLLLFTTLLVSQQNTLSESADISIITSGPGEGLYEKFGHAAIRIKDDAFNFDEIYNYGIFDFNGPNFYLNFSKGYMKYKLARYPFFYAIQSANEDKRWVKEQVLNLNQEEKNKIFHFLENNILPENASYLYDPFFNNCATKPRDILKKILGNKLTLSNNYKNNSSLRRLMNNKIHQNTWGSLGINLALGSLLDKKATSEQYMYLPYFLHKALENSKIKRHHTEINFIKTSRTLLNFKTRLPKSDFISPLLIGFLFFILTLLITFKDLKNKKRTYWLDSILFSITGFCGLIIIYLWFFTNHSTAPYNFNILWAFTPNIILLFLKKEKNKHWLKYYFFLLIALLLTVPVIWILEIQVFNWSLIPFLSAFLIRYIYLQKTLNS